MTLLIISVVVALSVSALCSVLEAAVLSLTPSQVANLSSRHPRVGAIWQHFKANIDRPIAVILILNTAAHTIGATLAGAQFEVVFGHAGLIWFSILFTFLMLQFTEILPKTLGVRYNLRLAPLIALPLAFLIRVLSPVVALVRLLNRPFERGPDQEQAVRLEEITSLAAQARLANLISPQQERIIRGTSQLSRQQVHDVMIPAEQVAFLSADQSLQEALAAAQTDPHTRFPVCAANDRDRVLGYVNFKEIIHGLQNELGELSIQDIIRPVFFTLPDRPATELLRIFVERHEHVAIVRDAAGRTLGLATLEDVIEELVGELEDEFDRLPRMLHRLKSGAWMVGGGVPVSELAGKLGLELPDAHGSTSAWLSRRFGRLPKVKEIYRHDGAEFTVRRTRRGKVFEVLVRPRTLAPLANVTDD